MPPSKSGGARPSSNTPSNPTTPTAPAIACLPPEIMIAIFSEFCSHCQDPTCKYESDNLELLQYCLARLAALCRTCRWMRRLAQPILFHQFATLSNPIDPAQLYRFVRTLIERPDLASAVRMLGLDNWRWFDPIGEPGMPRLIPDVGGEEFEQIETAAARFGLVYNPRGPEETGGGIHLDSRGCAFLVRLAICLCPNLKGINFGQFTERYAPWFWDDAIEAPSGTLLCGNAKVLRLRGSYCPGHHTRGFDMQHLLGLVDTAPKLKTLQLMFARFIDKKVDNSNMDTDGSGDEKDGPRDRVQSPLSFNLGCLTRLDLVHCSLSRNRLGQILRSCSHLIDFTYIETNRDFDLGFPRSEAAADRPVKPHELTRILQDGCPHLRATLRRLTLEHLPRYHHSFDSCYSSIDRLDAVEELYLGANGLMGDSAHRSAINRLSQLVPRNIKVLHIFEGREWEEEIGDGLIKLLEDMQSGRAGLAGLKEIRVSFRPLWPWFKYYSRVLDVEDGRYWYMGWTGGCYLHPKVRMLANAVGVTLREERLGEPDSSPPAVQDCSYFTMPPRPSYLGSADSSEAGEED